VNFEKDTPAKLIFQSPGRISEKTPSDSVIHESEGQRVSGSLFDR
jgi:hypothetical protein